jgi:hypothetical protein
MVFKERSCACLWEKKDHLSVVEWKLFREEDWLEWRNVILSFTLTWMLTSLKDV